MISPERALFLRRSSEQYEQERQRARAAGLFRQPDLIKRIRVEPTLKGLHGRDDFKQFLADLDADQPPKAGPKK